MHYVTTALERVVPPDQVRTAFQALVLKDVEVVADSIVEAKPPLLERFVVDGEPAYRVTGNGIV